MLHLRRITGLSRAIAYALRSALVVALLGFAVSGCDRSLPRLDAGTDAYRQFPVVEQTAPRPYTIGALDAISINVFQEPELTLQNVPVDSSGAILLPLIGTLQASGKTTQVLAREIADKLRPRFLKNPQVTVVVQTSASQRVTVEGQVTEPGVYDLKGRTTLLDALALAKGPTRVARLNEVVIFRDIRGERQGALFDLRLIRRGEAADPEILAGDRVVVGLSNVKAAWRDILTAAPLLSAFRVVGGL